MHQHLPVAEPNLSWCQTWLEPFAVTDAVCQQLLNEWVSSADFFTHMTRGQTSGQQGGPKLWQDKWVSQAEDTLRQQGWKTSLDVMTKSATLVTKKTPIFPYYKEKSLLSFGEKNPVPTVSPHLQDWRAIHTLLAIGAVPQIPWTLYPRTLLQGDTEL